MTTDQLPDPEAADTTTDEGDEGTARDDPEVQPAPGGVETGKPGLDHDQAASNPDRDTRD